MIKKGGNFLEEHVEKIVLACVGAVCVWLLITRVIISPNYVAFDKEKFGPGDVDNYILNSREAKDLRNKLNNKPKPKEKYKSQSGDFAALVDGKIAYSSGVEQAGAKTYAKCYPLTTERYPLSANYAISDIDVSVGIPKPSIAKGIGIQPRYNLPRWIGEVNDVVVEHIRAVAYVPTREVDKENAYNEAGSEPNDIDFVTVEARFDVFQLYERFYESFAGEDVNEEWRDPCLVEPIFAAVQLQRQEKLADDSWSDWQIVPRTKVDASKKMFEVIEEVEGLPPGGIKVRLLEFGDTQIQAGLLQPETYRIASAREDWYPPSLHKEYAEYQKEVAMQEKREARGEEMAEREEQREEARTERERVRAERERKAAQMRTQRSGRGGGTQGGTSMMDMMMGGGGPGMLQMPTTRRDQSKIRRERGRQARLKELRERKSEKGRAESKEPSKTVSDFDDELDEILITDETDFSKMSEPLVFWAHDDTVEPEKSYRYKIRLGAFNPIAGTDQFSERCKDLKNKVVLWSGFSDVAETVEIPGMLYFFPRELQEAADVATVRVTVSRYALGYWYSKDFTVKSGEAIGMVAEPEIVEEENEEENKQKGEVATIPETIDYSTGAVLVDVMPVNDWWGTKNLRARYYFDMLYSLDGTNIEHMAIKPVCWAEGLQAKFNEIKKSEREPKEPLRGWSSRPAGGRRGEGRRRGPTPAGPGPDEMEEYIRMMMESGMY